MNFTATVQLDGKTATGIRLERPVTRRQLALAAGVNAGHATEVLDRK